MLYSQNFREVRRVDLDMILRELTEINKELQDISSILESRHVEIIIGSQEKHELNSSDIDFQRMRQSAIVKYEISNGFYMGNELERKETDPDVQYHEQLEKLKTIWESSRRRLSDSEIKQFRDKVHKFLLD